MVNFFINLGIDFVSASTAELAVILIAEVVVIYGFGFFILDRLDERDEYA